MEKDGAVWVDEMVVAPGAPMPAYHPSQEDLDLMSFLLPLYEEYRKIPPRLKVEGGALYAGESIAKGRVVVEYLGAWEPGSKTPSSYRFGPINGQHYRNFAGMAEDGFPNMTPFYLYGVRELPLRVVFVALEEIAEGDILTFNYGPNHSVKLQEHLEYRLDQMVSFFSQISIASCLEKIKELHCQRRSALGWERCLELENLVAKVQYLYQTPSALMHLLEDHEVRYFWQKPDYRYYLLGVPFDPNSRERAWMECVDMLLDHCAEKRV